MSAVGVFVSPTMIERAVEACIRTWQDFYLAEVGEADGLTRETGLRNFKGVVTTAERGRLTEDAFPLALVTTVNVRDLEAYRGDLGETRWAAWFDVAVSAMEFDSEPELAARFSRLYATALMLICVQQLPGWALGTGGATIGNVSPEGMQPGTTVTGTDANRRTVDTTVIALNVYVENMIATGGPDVPPDPPRDPAPDGPARETVEVLVLHEAP